MPGGAEERARYLAAHPRIAAADSTDHHAHTQGRRKKGAGAAYERHLLLLELAGTSGYVASYRPAKGCGNKGAAAYCRGDVEPDKQGAAVAAGGEGAAKGRGNKGAVAYCRGDVDAVATGESDDQGVPVTVAGVSTYTPPSGAQAAVPGLGEWAPSPSPW